MRITLSVDERKEAYRWYIEDRVGITDDEELIISMPGYASDSVTVEIVRKPPQEQPPRSTPAELGAEM